MEQLVTEVLRHAARGVPLEHIEAIIEEHPGVDEQERAAIWLMAWSLTDDTTTAVEFAALCGRP